MKWATSDHIHLVRVACPWLIRRFIDPQAEFVFVPWGQPVPDGTSPVAMDGSVLPPHDEQSTAFDKLLDRYHLDDPALHKMAGIIASGVHASIHQGQPDMAGGGAPEGSGIMAVSRGMMLLEPDDARNLDRAMAIYDALYLYCWGELELARDPGLRKMSIVERTDALRSRAPRIVGVQT